MSVTPGTSWEALAAARTRGDVGEGIASVLALLGLPDLISFAGGFPDPLQRLLDVPCLVVLDRGLDQADLDFACFHGGRKLGPPEAFGNPGVRFAAPPSSGYQARLP